MRQVLVLHPDSYCDAVFRIEVDVLRPQPNELVLRYLVTGRIGDLLLPPGNFAGRADELWRHTCFEAFVLATPPAYFEFNFSASRQWAGYAFEGYRSGMRNAYVPAAPRIGTKISDSELEVDVVLERLPLSEACRIGLCAVVEETNGRKSYWALAHLRGKPDFHHADGFALTLPGATRA
ncbi:MAG: DOMON-like domain-containing protein [Rhizomicrobium sp.]|jgi:hypothetical protein